MLLLYIGPTQCARYVTVYIVGLRIHRRLDQSLDAPLTSELHAWHRAIEPQVYRNGTPTAPGVDRSGDKATSAQPRPFGRVRSGNEITSAQPSPAPWRHACGMAEYSPPLALWQSRGLGTPDFSLGYIYELQADDGVTLLFNQESYEICDMFS